jgi:hypothetical protein
MLSLGGIPIDDQIDAVMGKLERDGKLHIYAPTDIVIPADINLGSEVQMSITEKEGIDPNIDNFKETFI